MIQKQVLFLCTGNYYRSRFAELLFNKVASELNMKWQAISRGVAVGKCATNIGFISEHALKALKLRDISCDENRFPQQATLHDIKDSDIIIALKETEHRPYIKELFPNYESKVEFWDIHDIDFLQPTEALPELEKKVNELINILKENNE